MRQGIDSLAYIIKQRFELDPFSGQVFLFCGGCKDRFKALYWDGQGFWLLYKRFENGKLNWPSDEKEVKELNSEQVEWLMKGFSITPIIFFYRGQEELPTKFPHAVERGQLITILSFGEAVIAIIGTYSLGENFLSSALLFFGMACMFINYMSQTFLGVDHKSKRPVGFLFYLHLIIVIEINMFTLSTELLADSHHAELGYWMLVVGVALFYLGTYGTTVFNQSMYRLQKGDRLILWSLGLATLLALIFVGTNVVGTGLALIIGSYALGVYFYISRKRLRKIHQVSQPDP